MRQFSKVVSSCELWSVFKLSVCDNGRESGPKGLVLVSKTPSKKRMKRKTSNDRITLASMTICLRLPMNSVMNYYVELELLLS